MIRKNDKYIQNELEKSLLLANLLKNSEEITKIINLVVIECVRCLKKNNKIVLMGNGGSAAEAQHIAAEFVGRFAFERPGLPAIALTTDTSIITAIGNDYGFEQIFSRQIETHCSEGDICIGYSTSGRSKNISLGFKKAKALRLTCIAMIGNQKTSLTKYCDYSIRIPMTDTAKIQEGHSIIGHIICGLIEKNLFQKLIK